MTRAVPSVASSQETFAELFPKSTLLRLGLSWSIVAVFVTGNGWWFAMPIATPLAIICFVLIFATILLAAFGVVREADHLAHKLGEPYGTLILTLSVVAIEVILIAAMMTGPGHTPTIGRDSVFAVMMIILNLVTGTCLLFGGHRYGEQEYNAQGATAYLSMIVLLTSTALLLPNLVSTGNGSFLPVQARAVAGFSTVLYAGFLTMQMRNYRQLFIQPAAGGLTVPAKPPVEIASGDKDIALSAQLFDRRAISVRAVTLAALMLPIILLSHFLAVLIDLGIEHAGAPVAVGGVLIAMIVFTPESITAVRAALANQMQRSINLCLGAFVSTVGLTVPAVLMIGLMTGKTVTLGLNSLDSALLVITLAVSALTFCGFRTSPIQGLIHLTLFGIYAVLLFVP